MLWVVAQSLCMRVCVWRRAGQLSNGVDCLLSCTPARRLTLPPYWGSLMVPPHALTPSELWTPW